MSDRSKRVEAERRIRQGDKPEWGELVDLASILAREPPKDGDNWGRWYLVARNWTLQFIDDLDRNLHELDLENEMDPAELCDFIFQVNGKVWATAEDIGDLCEAIDDILYTAQSTICGLGKSRTVIPANCLQDQWECQARSDRFKLPPEADALIDWLNRPE